MTTLYHDETRVTARVLCLFGPLLALSLIAAPTLAETPEVLRTQEHLLRFQDYGEYFDAHPELRETPSSGWKPYNRALWHAATRPVPTGVSAAKLREEAMQVGLERESDSGSRGAGWFNVGPTRMSGRCVSMDADPLDSDIVYVGSASGGLWKSTDGGDSWRTTTDDLPTLAIGAICVLDWNPDVVLIGTGEGSGAGFSANGAGLFRSTDGAETWQTTNLSYPVSAFHGFNHIEDNPANQTILAAANDGLYRSSDDGVTWSLVEGAGNFMDVKWKPGDPNRVYVTKCKDPFGNSQNDNGVKVSTDDGLTFNIAGVGQPAGSSVAKTKIAVSASDPSVIYAHYVNISNFQTLGIYRSSDDGATWVAQNNTLNMTGGQGWYNNVLTVDPDDPDRVLAAGVLLYLSTDGGVNWVAQNPTDGFGTETNPHWDNHFLQYPRGSSDELWLCTDGGPWRSTDDGSTWHSRREGIVTYQYYDICVAQTDPEFVVGGTQDNGLPYRTGFDTWHESTWFADGMVCNISTTDRDLVYGEWQNGNHLRSTTGGFNWSTIMNGITGTGIWVTPVDLDPTDDEHLYTMTNAGIFRSTNRGSQWVNVATHFARWISISPLDGDMVWTVSNFSGLFHTTDDGTNWISSGSFPASGIETKVHAHPTNRDWAFVSHGGYATGGSHLVLTTNRGTSWFSVSGDFPDIPANTFIVDPSHPGDWYIGADLGVWRSTNNGFHWELFGTGLANAQIADLEIKDADRKLIAGTHGRGAWEISLDGSASIESPATSSARNLMLDPPYPNPVQDAVRLRFAVRPGAPGELSIHDAEGRLISQSESVPDDGLIRTNTWHTGEVANGVYFAILRAGGEKLSRKIVVER